MQLNFDQLTSKGMKSNAPQKRHNRSLRNKAEDKEQALGYVGKIYAVRVNQDKPNSCNSRNLAMDTPNTTDRLVSAGVQEEREGESVDGISRPCLKALLQIHQST